MEKTYELMPNAKMLLSSLRSVGYTEETAIADIVDNSISSGANTIQLYFDWDDQTILIADNGKGMQKKELLDSMKIGSSDPGVTRSASDLGRFGMGMKTASFSLGKQLLVISKQKDEINNAEWNLEYVENEDKWEILIHSDEKIDTYIKSKTDKIEFQNWDEGTLISLSMLDKLIDENNMQKSKVKFYKTVEKVKKHLAMIFHRFIEEDNLQIYVNKNLLEAWNPFIRQNPATMELACEELFDGKTIVSIEPYILPHKTKFEDEEAFKKAGGAKDWLAHQGFYVYRNRRSADNNHLFLENVSSHKIIEFFTEFKTSKYASKVNGNNIATYIKEQNKDNLLIDWTVCLINVGKTNPGFEIAGYKIRNGITRHGENSVVPLRNGKVCSVHMLKSKGHEYYALNQQEYEEALHMEESSDKGKESTIAANIRAKMDPRKGLLLIYPIDYHDAEAKTSNFKIGNGEHNPPFGLVVVFPKGNGKSISYQVNPIATKGDGYDIFD